MLQIINMTLLSYVLTMVRLKVLGYHLVIMSEYLGSIIEFTQESLHNKYPLFIFEELLEIT